MLGIVRTPLVAMLALATTLACAPPPPRTASPPQPLDEGRALALAAQAFADAGAVATGGRDVQLVTGHRLHADLMAAGHRWGVAFVTEEEAGEIRAGAEYVPPQGEDLPVVMGFGPDADVVVCVLFARDYTHSADRNGAHGSTLLAVEKRLQRDVRDFVVQAIAHKLK